MAIGRNFKGITIQFGADTTGLDKALKSIQKETRATQTELNKVNKALKLDPKNTELLTQKQTLLKEAITQTTKKLDSLKQAQEKVNKAHSANAAWEKKYAPLQEKIESTAKKMKQLASQEESMKKKLSEGAISTEQYDKYQSQLQEVIQEHKNLITSKKDLEKSFKDGHISDQEYREYNRTIVETESKLKSLNLQLAEVSSKAMLSGETLQKAGNRMKDLGGKLDNVGNKLTIGVTAPLTAIGGYAVKSAMDFESAWTGVTKTVDGTAVQMDNLRQGIIDMSEELPASTTEIAEVAEAAGQLGIQTDNVLDFTRTMIDLGESTNLSASEGAESLAKFANITGMSQKDFDKLGSTIVALGNNFATTEADITAMGLNLAAAGSQVGMSEAQIMGFATSLSSVGIEAEAGGTAFSKLMINMQLAAERGGEELNNFASVAGMSADKFKTAFEQDAAGAITQFIQGLSTCEERGQSAIGILDGMGITESRMRDAILRAAGASDVFTQAIDMGTNAWNENIALTQEADKRYSTTASKMEIAKNKLTNSAASIGESLLPTLSDLAESLADITKRFSNLNDGAKTNILRFAGIAAAAGPVTKVLGKTASAVGSLTSGIGKLSKDFGKLSSLKKAQEAIAGVGSFSAKSADGVSGFSKALFALGSPTGIATTAAVAVAALGTAYAVHKYNLTQADQATKDLINSSQNLKKTQDEVLAQSEEKKETALAEAATNELLIDKLYELNDKEGKSNSEKQTMISLVDELNSRIPDLNLAIDEETGKLDKQKDAVLEYNEAFRKKLLIEAAQERLTTIAKAQIETQGKLAELVAKRAEKQEELNEKQDEYNEAIDKVNQNPALANDSYIQKTIEDYASVKNSVEDLDEEIKNNQETLKDYEFQWNETTSYIDQANDATKDAAKSIRQTFARLGVEVSDGFINVIAASSPEVQKSVQDLFGSIKLGTQANSEQVKGLFAGLGISISDSLCNSIATKSPEVQAGTIDLLAQLKSGVSLSETDIRTLYSNLGIEVSNSLIGSIQAATPNVQLQAVNLIQQISTASDAQKPQLLANLAALGIEVDSSLAQGLNNNVQVVRDSATGTINCLRDSAGNQITNITPQFAQMLANMGIIGVHEMDAVVSTSTINAPTVKNIDAQGWVSSNLSAIQGWMDKKSVTLQVKGKYVTYDQDFVGPRPFVPHAKGGVIEEPTFALMGEEYPEAIIPLDPARKSRAVSLLHQTAGMIGASAKNVNLLAGFSESRINENVLMASGYFDYDLLANKIADIMMATKGANQVTQNLTIHSPTPLSPAETARLNRIECQRLVAKLR